MAITTSTTTETNRCAHKLCKCMAPQGESYCSPFCKDSKDVTTLTCDCGHPQCATAKL